MILATISQKTVMEIIYFKERIRLIETIGGRLGCVQLRMRVEDNWMIHCYFYSN